MIEADVLFCEVNEHKTIVLDDDATNMDLEEGIREAFMDELSPFGDVDALELSITHDTSFRFLEERSNYQTKLRDILTDEQLRSPFYVTVENHLTDEQLRAPSYENHLRPTAIEVTLAGTHIGTTINYVSYPSLREVLYALRHDATFEGMNVECRSLQYLGEPINCDADFQRVLSLTHAATVSFELSPYILSTTDSPLEIGENSYCVMRRDGNNYLAAELEMGSVFYRITLYDNNGDLSFVDIPSTQCFVNDTGDHQPYAVLTKSALQTIQAGLQVRPAKVHVKLISPTANTDHRGRNRDFINAPVNRRYNWRRPAEANRGNLFDGIRIFGYDFDEVSWSELPFFLMERLYSFVRQFTATLVELVRTGALARLFYCVLGLLKYFVVMEIFDIKYYLAQRHPVVYRCIIVACVIFTLFDESNINNLREIFTRDLSGVTGRDYIMKGLQYAKVLKNICNIIYASTSENMIHFILGNNRENLRINDHGNRYKAPVMRLVDYGSNVLVRYPMILLQDIVCFFATLIPSYYVTFNLEVVKRISKVEQEQFERETASERTNSQSSASASSTAPVSTGAVIDGSGSDIDNEE